MNPLEFVADAETTAGKKRPFISRLRLSLELEPSRFWWAFDLRQNIRSTDVV